MLLSEIWKIITESYKEAKKWSDEEWRRVKLKRKLELDENSLVDHDDESSAKRHRN